MWVYKQTEANLFTVGYYAPAEGSAAGWFSESDHATRDEAAKRVHYLNGGSAEYVTDAADRLAVVVQESGWTPSQLPDTPDEPN